MQPPLVPAEPAAAGDGTPYSSIYQDVYNAAHGAVAQTRHVFLAGNHLPARWHGADSFVIGETGFGLGLNFRVTWHAWRESGASGRLHFVSIEKHPLRRNDLAHLLAAHAELSPLADELLQQWPALTHGFHRLHFEQDRLTLTLLLDDAQTLLPQLASQFDAIYLDGFAPAKNPDLWSPAVLVALTRLCRHQATLATWSVVGELRRTLQRAGWRLERRNGFAGKRQMLAGRLESPSQPGRHAIEPATVLSRHNQAPQRQAIVIGAGLAGTAISERLASRGWQVDMFERHAAPALEASGNPAGVLLPHMAKDDALAARLSRSCYLYALRRFADLPALCWSPCGVLQIARDAAHEALQRATVLRLQLPAEVATFLERDAATALIGRPLTHGGWWFPGGGWVSPSSLCTALLAAGGPLIQAHFNTEIAALRRDTDGWQVIDDKGNVLARAPHLILANAHAANRLLPVALPLTPIRGQISYLPDQPLHDTGPPLRHVICRSGYLTPPQEGRFCVGASFDSGDTDLQIRSADHAGNLQRLDELLPGTVQHWLTDTHQTSDAALFDGRVGLRTAAPDRLPLIDSR